MNGADPKDFGRRLRARREEVGLSQKKMGEALRSQGLRGYSQQNIGSLESGLIKDPRQAAADLAGPLRTTPDWLLFGKGPKEVLPPLLTGDEFEELPVDFRAEVTDLWMQRQRPQHKRA